MRYLAFGFGLTMNRPFGLVGSERFTPAAVSAEAGCAPLAPLPVPVEATTGVIGAICDTLSCVRPGIRSAGLCVVTLPVMVMPPGLPAPVVVLVPAPPVSPRRLPPEDCRMALIVTIEPVTLAPIVYWPF